ncbi:hypothetical protein Pyn_26977 [Prunus yedoensis var. nudiflora]|uniref:Uncharacterized protein n=1 Tax=Prunus yedoensis var. nudiflora TaxID=2094558 RepID=A0A314XKK5_PRUYE|nr:hypothetical protein Pyn_26977 [Prunus yedoensis var. nudiflora]
MDVMREELPNTMAAVRISRMELSVLGCHYHFKDCIAKSKGLWTFHAYLVRFSPSSESLIFRS